MLTIEREGSIAVAPFSICSSPLHFKETGQIEFAVRRQDKGKMTTWLCDELQVGDWLQLSPALGEFILRDPERPILLVAPKYGSPFDDMVSKWASSSRFRAQLMMYTRANEQVFASRAGTVSTQGAESGMTSSLSTKPGKQGRAAIFRWPSWCRSARILRNEIYVCGPGCDGSKRIHTFGRTRCRTSWIHHELFLQTRRQALRGGSAEVHISTVERGQVVQLAEGTVNPCWRWWRAGYRPRYGCRQGICHECTMHQAEWAGAESPDRALV